MLSFRIDQKINVPENASGSYCKDFSRSGDAVNVSWGKWNKWPDQGLAVYVSRSEWGICFTMSGEYFDAFRAATTAEECEALFMKILFSYFSENPERFADFIAAIKEKAWSDGLRDKQIELRKVLGF